MSSVMDDSKSDNQKENKKIFNSEAVDNKNQSPKKIQKNQNNESLDYNQEYDDSDDGFNKKVNQ